MHICGQYKNARSCILLEKNWFFDNLEYAYDEEPTKDP